MTERIATFQQVQDQWEEGVVDPRERTPQLRFARMIEEVMEADEALANLDGSVEKQIELGYEIADIIIVAMGVLGSLYLDGESLIREKLEINHIKYSVEENARLRSLGMTYAEARAEQKKLWTKPKS